MTRFAFSLFVLGAVVVLGGTLSTGSQQPPAETETSQAPEMLEAVLRARPVEELLAAAERHGDAVRGAAVFFRPETGCARCHVEYPGTGRLGPELTDLPDDVTPESIVESLLYPSRTIRAGFESITVITFDGRNHSGLVVEETDSELVLRDAEQGGVDHRIPLEEIDLRQKSPISLMPDGITNLLRDEQDFIDMLRFLLEVDGDPARFAELQPPAALWAPPPLPAYEQQLDHRGLIASWDEESFRRGEALYERVCANCHGTHSRAGSLPAAPRFAEAPLKGGADPYSLYQVLTRGRGAMIAQSWMVPQQKYDVIHYVREAYFRDHQPSYYVPVDEGYLAGLPEGTERGPEPRSLEPWATMDYGPSLAATYEVGRDGQNFAYKGIAVRVDAGGGGVAQGRAWMLFDHDTMRMAAAWTGDRFIDWDSILFNGRHGVHPHVQGRVHVENTGPGWAGPSGTFTDPRLRGRDDRAYGPLPRDWTHYRGQYRYEHLRIFDYRVGETDVLEMPGLDGSLSDPVFLRTFNIGPRADRMILRVASVDDDEWQTADRGNAVSVGMPESTPADASARFDGQTSVLVENTDDFDMTEEDYTIRARFRTTEGGTLFAKAPRQGPWAPDGKTLFVRGGRLVFDIGWVGQVASRRPVDDGKWHDVVMTWRQRDARVDLYVDGTHEATGTLRPRDREGDHVVRIGFTSPDFPGPQSFFVGDLAEVSFARGRWQPAEATDDSASVKLVARWRLDDLAARPQDLVGAHHGRLEQPVELESSGGPLVAGVSPPVPEAAWRVQDEALLLEIPAGNEPLAFTLWTHRATVAATASQALESYTPPNPAINLAAWCRGGPGQLQQVLEAPIEPFTTGDTPLEVETLSHPQDDPWLCRMRFTGLDFLPGADALAVCTWDGDVWRVDGLNGGPGSSLQWRRIANGLFQPLGLVVVDGKIYVGCRDQIVILHDLNGDGESDYYENFNSDHQVTEHFHEFAMGLQRDDQGNFYYAKSARHALPALVPHHGTLLRVTPDGRRTEILATGFRAANGVCLNPDGSFVVTDQEGHWTPKNRINWVREGGFYGNMWGYHDVTDTSDDAMESPLCWITNAFDRSPAELLWLDHPAWGPLQDSLISLSYGYGDLFVVPHERVGDQMQGGMCRLPIPRFPTGIIRGRLHPETGDLYTCGMFAWAGNQQQPGGLYRIRYTGDPLHVVTGLEARDGRVRLRFSGPLDRTVAGDPQRYAVKAWDLRRSERYGSEHHRERTWRVTHATLSADDRTVEVVIPEIGPTRGMEIRYDVRAATGETVRGSVHNTIHQLPVSD